MPCVLNVGGFSKTIPIPSIYDGWEHLMLDIDPQNNPDLVLDARLLETSEPAQFDAIYCSHNLEHYYRHDVVKVLRGFQHVLKPNGFVHILVPDLLQLIRFVAARNMDINDFLYQSVTGPITVCDVIYGRGLQVEQSGQDYWAHKNGFSENSLVMLLQSMGFPLVYHQSTDFEIRAFAFKSPPTEFVANLLGLPVQSIPPISTPN